MNKKQVTYGAAAVAGVAIIAADAIDNWTESHPKQFLFGSVGKFMMTLTEIVKGAVMNDER